MNRTLDEIQSRLIDRQSLSANERDVLQLMLDAEPELIQRMAVDEQIDGMLRTFARCDDPRDMFVNNVMAAIAAPTHFPQLAETEDSVAVLGTFANRRRSRRLLLTASVLAAALIGAVLLIAFVQKSKDDQNDDRRHQPPSGIADKSNAPGGARRQTRSISQKKVPGTKNHNNDDGPGPVEIARIVVAEDCRWKDGKSPGSSLSQGSLHLLAGKTTIQFESGVVVELTGPSVFTIRSPSTAFLQSGRVSATVPKQAIGFTVETPSSTIVDLGTRFEVAVELAGTVQVNVREGSVEYRERSAKGEFVKRWRLTAGDSHREQPIATQTGTVDSRRSIHGATIINGKRYRYDSREVFEILQKEKARLHTGKP